MMRLLTGVLLLVATTAWGGEPRHAAMLAHRHDRVVKRSVVPSSGPPQGEVQVVQRGDLVVVQTLLASRVLRRVAAAIAAREERRWPAGSDGHAGSLRYREELHRAVEEAWEVFRQRRDQEELRQFLSIEFIDGPRYSLVALSLPRLRGEPGTLQLVDKQLLAVWGAPRSYVTFNSAAIVADSFALDEAAAAALLSSLRRTD